MTKIYKTAFLNLLLAASLSGCSTATDQDQLKNLNNKVNLLSQGHDNQQLLNLFNNYNNLQNQIQQQNGQLSNLENQLSEHLKLQDQLNRALENQILSIGGSRVQLLPQLTVSAVPGTSTTSQPLVNQAAPGTAVPTLDLALDQLNNKNYQSAVLTLKALIQQNPSNLSLVSQSQYYLSVAYAASGDYQEAITTANAFMNAAPNDPHVPDALWVVYVSQMHLNLANDALKTKSKILTSFPDSKAASLLK